MPDIIDPEFDTESLGAHAAAFGLSIMKVKFVYAYLELIGERGQARGVKQEAALRAGSTEKHARNFGYRCLRDPAVNALIVKLLAPAMKAVKVDRSVVLQKALLASYMAEQQGNPMIMIRAAELLGKHVDVLAFAKEQAGIMDGIADDDDLSALDDDELATLIRLKRKIRLARPDTGAAGAGDVAPGVEPEAG